MFLFYLYISLFLPINLLSLLYHYNFMYVINSSWCACNATRMRVVLGTAQGRLTLQGSRAATFTRFPVSGPPNCVAWRSAVPH